ncbi:MAG: zinc metallopeptidase [Bacteroidaceae bacterium]|jgi:Zn-dependent membrane protease YugP|nr:zinc metallopeptidase [Bacteroidaceae bacterium]MBO5951781.1 zinc metallopeptidase [Bacteroidaceae bacterium]MBQ5573795.1 zinc metallopeptidase [Bacteroidaceae bacterium]MBR4303502.1 zinc metallopeptidase [Bacteroidaceae bacterium]
MEISYFGLFIFIAVISFVVQNNLQRKFSKYSRIATNGNVSGAEVARLMLQQYGIKDVTVTCVDGQLTDHYNPENKTVNLSRDVYNGRNIAAAAVAAHECGHAVQHAVAYAPLKMRSALVPVVTFASQWVTWVILIGILVINVFPGLIWIGILLFASTTVFSFITLPVEVDASRRALSWLSQSNITTAQTSNQASDALRSAAYTYVVGAISSLGTLLYYISIARRD